MSLRIVHPTKEQVRAYMAQRERARRPPPAPEEIRRQLGWRIARADEPLPLLQFYLIPTTCGELVAHVMLSWWLARTRTFLRRAPRMK